MTLKPNTMDKVYHIQYRQNEVNTGVNITVKAGKTEEEEALKKFKDNHKGAKLHYMQDKGYAKDLNK